MKITIVQSDPEWENKYRNLKKLDELISSLNGDTDIIVLPEMFTTGFSMNPKDLSEAPFSETYEWMGNHSVKGNFGICGSYIVKQDEHFFNRWIFVSPESNSWHYDKRHLFTMRNENRIYTQGNKRIVFSFRGVRICPNICYDLRFPVWSRNLNDYDLLINSANWPEIRREVWSILLKARAIENQCFVVGVNRVGYDNSGILHMGDSIILDPRGNIITELNENKEGVATGEISLSELNDFRKEFPALQDADNFSITL